MELTRMSEWVSSLDIQEIPKTILDHAKVTIMDTVSVMMRGCRHQEMEPLIRQIAKSYPGHTFVLGTDDTVLPEWAAFLNATGGSFLELDEGQRPTGHPAIHVIPTALSFSSQLNKTGGEFLESVIVGYEIQSRISRSTLLRWEIHPHGNMGTPAAAATIAKLKGKNSQQITEVMNIGATLSMGTSWTPCYEGATVRNTYAGVSALMANLANILAEAKFNGLDNAFMDVYNNGILANWFDMEGFTSQLGETYAIEDNYFKFHACCALNHSPLDAVTELLQKEDIPLDAITQIIVEGNKGHVRLANVPVKQRELAYKFSIPYAIATLLYHKHTNLEAFSEEGNNPVIQSLAEKVKVVENKQYTKVWPEQSKSQVMVITSNGKFTADCSNPIGSVTNRMSLDTLYAKTEDLVHPYISDINEYFSLFEKLDQYDSLQKWIKDLTTLYRR
ncbi:MmgE/PrpD family protein [Bacillus sp. JJ1773]|uniref:MmgE/PrpD family protein n=1 Tax=Bacillus sp. JJ1773 TaxID=3122965 RepID=UPI002FFFEF1F